jgi:chromosome segregation ATPase
MSVEQMKAKTINQLADIGKKSEAIGRLKLELGEKTAALFALEAKERQLTDDLQGTELELRSKSEALEEAQRALAQAQAELEQVSSSFHESSTATDDQRVELVALRAQSEALKGQVESYEQESGDLLARLGAKTGEVELLSQQLADERARSDQLGTRLGELDRQIIVRTTDSEVLERRFQELTVRFDQQSRSLAERENASDRFVADLETARRTEAEVRHALADAEDRHRFATETVRAEKALVEEELRQMREERTRLQREIASLKRDAENTGANERMENAILRERINDVAAEMARLTATLEGPGSRIDSLLGSEAGAPATPNGGNGAPPIAPGGAEPKGSLADRIRALQSRASRASQPSGT